MGYITDIGMTGSSDSVLGRKAENVIKAFRTQMPYTFELASGDVRLNGIVATVDSTTKCTEFIERVQLKEASYDEVSYDSDDGKPEYFNDF